jgi:predicted 3-demethylubiquinone-9 3-methyltransferase (glyoxalase superfamily)
MQKITTFLTFNNQAEEAAKLYTSLFKNSKITWSTPGPDGNVMWVSFNIDGQEFYALNGGERPEFHFSEGMSLFVTCEGQEEVDYYWDNLIADGGEPSMCGWLKDKFGVSWQIIPTALNRLLSDPDPARAGRVMEAMLKMSKIDIATLENA